jgi:hypothetical protein
VEWLEMGIPKSLEEGMLKDTQALQAAMANELAGIDSTAVTTSAVTSSMPSLSLNVFQGIVRSVKERDKADRSAHPKEPMFLGPALELVAVEPLPIYDWARKHRKSRINKKWRKRYGKHIVGFDRFLGESVLIDEKRSVGYCHPDIKNLLVQSLPVLGAGRDTTGTGAWSSINDKQWQPRAQISV